MSDTIGVSVPVVTVTEMTVPRWMTPYVRPLFAIPTHMTAQERLALFQSALNLPTGFTVVEIGSYLGASTAFLAYAALNKNGTIHAIDTWGNESMGGEGTRDTWNEFHANTQPFEHFITTHRGHSIAVARNEAPIPCDLLFIDGDHHLDAVIADLKHWLPSLKPGGVLAMHDVDHPEVKQAFDTVVGQDRVGADAKVIDRLLLCRPTGFTP